MARILVWGPASTPQDRDVLQAVAASFPGGGHTATVRPTDGTHGVAFPDIKRAVEGSDAVVAVLDGLPPDAGTLVVVALAHAWRRPVVGLRSDTRTLPDDVAKPLRSVCADLVPVTSWSKDALGPALQPFLRSVKVFAGTLVRDAVPQILEKEGRPLRFRTVDPPAYPQVLKRKIVETAQRVEEAEFGVEQEEIADLLEALETLINLRKYDRESLRSIKEGKWRRRGGFERGLLLEEEPGATAVPANGSPPAEKA